MITNSIIYGINLNVPLSEFEQGLDSRCQSTDMHYNINVKRSKKGYSIAEIRINYDSVADQEAVFLFPLSNNNTSINFISTSFKEMNKTFYAYTFEDREDDTVYYYSEDPFSLFCEYIKDLAIDKGGTMIYKTYEGEPIAIIDGKQKIVSPCVVDVYGKVYGPTIKDDIAVSVDEDVDGITLKEWLREHKEEEVIKNILTSDKSNTEKYYAIAKYLMALKQEEKISQELFKSLFEQAGIFDKFENDNTLSVVYKLLF